MDIATRLTRLGRDPQAHEGAVNPPVQRGSTVIIENADELYGDGRKTYGLEGFSTHERLEQALASVCGGTGSVLAPSGLQALTLAVMTVAGRSGDHILVTDSAYGPLRRFCTEVMADYGVETTFYDPLIGGGIADLIRERTRLIVLESPGSLTFEMQDVPAIVAQAQARSVTTLVDDTWSAGVHWRPLEIGVDISMQALTKYQGGHADVLAGALITRDPALEARLRRMHRLLGVGVSAEEAWLVLRGLRTMKLRMDHVDRSARTLALWLEARPEVARVLHPALPSHPQHALWQRDFTGAGGLFSFELKLPVPRDKLHAMLEACRLFSMGFSWGGFESLIVPCDPQIRRTAVPWQAAGPLVRVSVGLEAIEDLMGDLDQAFCALR
jgi:cysteine-S-conjugate beta-lyase